MKVHRMEIAASPMLRELEVYLRTLPRPGFFVCNFNTDVGDWRADVSGGPPTDDRPTPRAFRRQHVKAPIRLPAMADDVIVSACNYFPVGGGGLGWHTDSHAPGWRVYIGRPLGAHVGVFHVDEPAANRSGLSRQVFTDEPGIATAFYVSGEPGQSWHAVTTEGPRLSIGIRFKAGRTQRGLGLPGGPS